MHRLLLTSQRLVQHLDQIREHMKAVRHLNGVWRAATGAFGAVRAAIPAHDGDLRLGLQPLDEGVRLAVRQQVNDTPARAVDQESAVALAAAHTPVVDAHHLRRWRRRQRRTADLAHERVGTREQSERPQEARARFTTNG
jgi:hypothetical protein